MSNHLHGWVAAVAIGACSAGAALGAEPPEFNCGKSFVTVQLMESGKPGAIVTVRKSLVRGITRVTSGRVLLSYDAPHSERKWEQIAVRPDVWAALVACLN